MRETSTIKRAAAKPVAAAKKRVEIPSSKGALNQGDFNQKVAQKAYELFVARGCAHGYDVEDWLAAEQIVRGS